MKKIIKIGALSLGLITSLLVMSTTTHAAQPAEIHFIITWTSNIQCTYGTSWDMWSYTASLNAFTASGSLTNFVCTDTQWLDNRSMTLQATSAVSNGNTAIPATNVSMQASTNYVSSGFCSTGTNTTIITPIWTTGWTIMAKSSAINQICQITTSSVTLNVDVPAAASIWIYTGSLSLTLPW